MLDPGRRQPRLCEGGALVHGVRVEQDQIGDRSHRDPSPVVQAQPVGRQGGEMDDRLGKRQHLLFPDVPAQVPGEGAGAAGVGLVAHQQTVAAAHVTLVAHDRADVGLVADVMEDAHGQTVLDQQVAEHLGRGPLLGPGDLGDGAAHPAGERGIAHSGDLHGVPVDRDPMVPVAALDLHHLSDPGASVGFGQHLQGVLEVAGGGPARQQRRQGRGAGQVRVGVQGDVRPTFEGPVDQLQQLAGAPAVLGEVHGGVGQVHRASGALADLEHLPVGLEGSGPIGALVGAVVAAVRGDHLTQSHQLLGVCEHPGHVGQARGHPEGAFAHALVDLFAHRLQLRRGRRPAGGADHIHADRALWQQVGDVGGAAAPVDLGQVLGDAAPAEIELGGHSVPAGDPVPHPGHGGVRDGCVGQAVLADHLGGHPLQGPGEVLTVGQHGQVGVGVHVDEPGGEGESVRMDAPRAGCVQAGTARRCPGSDRRDPASLQQHVGHIGFAAAAVEDQGTEDQDVRGIPSGQGRGQNGHGAHPKAVSSRSIARGTSAWSSSMTTMPRHLSKTVQGWESPKRITSPTSRAVCGGIVTKVC